MGEEGLHRPGQGRHMPHRVTRSRISGLCRGEADDSTHSLRVCQPPVTFPGKWPSSGWYCRYPPDTCSNGVGDVNNRTSLRPALAATGSAIV